MNTKEQIIQQEIQKIVDKVSCRRIETNACLAANQLDIISQLNSFCASKILNDIEVCKDPRKITYKTNQELKLALVALCLSVTLTKHRAKNFYNKEYFEDNILVEHHMPDILSINFINIEDFIIDSAIESELVFDWLVYRDFEGRGIQALINEKMCDFELDGFNAGGCPVYEFARFQRKYHDFKRRKQNKDKENAQETFRNAIVHEVATQIASQQMLNGSNPLELVNMLFDSKDVGKALTQLSQENKPEIKKILYKK